MPCLKAKLAVSASYAALVGSVAVELGSAGTLTVVALGGAILSIVGLLGALSELHTCLINADRLDEAQRLQAQISQLQQEKARLENLIPH